LFDGDWGFGQDRQERKWGFRLHIIVDVIGQYIQNANRVERKEGGEVATERQRGVNFVVCDSSLAAR